MDPMQTLPPLRAMITENFTLSQWLTYYQNIWTRNLAARMIDVETDAALKTEDPEQEVQMDDGRTVAVKVRLEHRKILVADSLALLSKIDALLALSPDDLKKKTSEDALAVAADMLPAKAATAFVHFKVLNDAGVTLENGNTAPKDSVIELDPTSENTKKLMAGGFIGEWKTPEAPVAPVTPTA